MVAGFVIVDAQGLSTGRPAAGAAVTTPAAAMTASQPRLAVRAGTVA